MIRWLFSFSLFNFHTIFPVDVFHDWSVFHWTHSPYSTAQLPASLKAEISLVWLPPPGPKLPWYWPLSPLHHLHAEICSFCSLWLFTCSCLKLRYFAAIGHGLQPPVWISMTVSFICFSFSPFSVRDLTEFFINLHNYLWSISWCNLWVFNSELKFCFVSRELSGIWCNLQHFLFYHLTFHHFCHLPHFLFGCVLKQLMAK